MIQLTLIEEEALTQLNHFVNEITTAQTFLGHDLDYWTRRMAKAIASSPDPDGEIDPDRYKAKLIDVMNSKLKVFNEELNDRVAKIESDFIRVEYFD